MAIDLIYCADGNRRLAEIAMSAGFLYGAQLPHTVYFRPWFVDQDWKKPNREKYMAALAEHRPHMASVIDWTPDVPLSMVLSWAEEAAEFVQIVMIVPKVHGGVSKLPRRIGGREARLGYSVPTKFGATELFAGEFTGWPVHLLGGTPHAQMDLAHYLDVRSVDGNYHNLKATKFCEYWQDGHWIPLKPKQQDAPYEAFRRSCVNIMAAWQALATPPQ